MKQITQVFSEIGIMKTYSPIKSRSIRVSNYAAAIGIAFSLFSIIVALTSGDVSNLFFALYMLFTLPLVYVFNARKKHNIARNLVLLIGLSCTSLSVMMTEITTFTYFDFIIILAIFLFIFPEKKESIVILFLTFFCFVLSVVGSQYDWLPKVTMNNSVTTGLINASLLLVIIFVVFRILITETQKVEKKMEDVLENLSKANLELKKAKSSTERINGQLVSSNLSLEHEVNERKKMEQSLIESNEALQQFAYIASHDLKEPLRTIGSFTNLLMRRIKDKIDDKDKEYVQFITNGVERMSMLLDDLLKYARLNNPAKFELVDVNKTVEVVKYNLKNLRDRQNAKMIIEPMPSLFASKSQLLQLFQNLVSNGIKFNKSKMPEVRIKCVEQLTEYVFSVTDNGIGIPKENQDKIFLIFQRLNGRDDFDGSGIGLSVVQKIVTNHQGKIWLESEEGMGTTFYFTIAKNLGEDMQEIKELKDTVASEVEQN